jgi:hypothetical protein
MTKPTVVNLDNQYGEHFEEYLMAALRNDVAGARREIFQLWLHDTFYCRYCDRPFGPDPTMVSEEDEIRCPACQWKA